MQMAEYQLLARRTQNPELNLKERKEHAMCGMASELGEICAHYQKVHQGHPLDVDKVVDELGDLMWFIAEFCDVLRIGMDEAAKRNIEKLKKRYPEGFSEERSRNREEAKPEGVKIRCYSDRDECRECSPDGWCGMYDRMCEEIHIDLTKEDGEE